MTVYQRYSFYNPSSPGEKSLVLLEESTGAGNRGDCLGSDILKLSTRLWASIFGKYSPLCFFQVLPVITFPWFSVRPFFWRLQKQEWEYQQLERTLQISNGKSFDERRLQRRLRYALVTDFFSSQWFNTKKGFIHHERYMFPMDSEGWRGVAPHWGHSGAHSDGSLGETGTPALVPTLTFHWTKLAVSTHHIKGAEK